MPRESEEAAVAELSALLGAELGPLVEPFTDRRAVPGGLSENEGCFKDALTELETSPREKIRERILHMEQELAPLFPWDFSSQSELTKANAYLSERAKAPFGLHLTNKAARRLLESCSPVNFLSAAGCKTLDELYARYAPLEVLALTRHTETKEWQQKYHDVLKDVRKQDFEERAVRVLTVDSESLDASLWNTHSPLKPWRMSHSKEAGLIISFTRPEDTHVVTPRLLHTLVFFHYFLETALSGAFLLIAANETPKTLGERLAGVITSAKDKFPFFYPNLYSENLFWIHAYRMFRDTFPTTHGAFFARTFDCGWYEREGDLASLLSLNLIDHVWDMNIAGTKEAQAYFKGNANAFFYHFREARWSKVFRKLLGLSEEAFEHEIMRCLDTGDQYFTRVEGGLYARGNWREHFGGLGKRSIIGMLRKSERSTKVDMVYPAKNGGWLGIGHVISVGSGFLLTLVLANAVPQEVYGTYSFLLSVAGILSAAALPGMLTAMIVAAAKGRMRDLQAVYRSRLLWGALGSLAALLGAGYYFLSENVPLSIGLLIIAIFMPFFEAATIYQGYWNGLGRFATLALSDGAVRIGAVAILILTALLAPDPLMLLAAYFVGYLVFRFVAYRYARKDAGEPTSAYEARSTLAFGKHLSAMSVSSLVATYIDKILLFHFLGPVEVAAYTIATTVPEQIRTVFRNLALLALPKLAEANRVPDKRVHLFRLGQLALLGTLVLGAYVLVAPLLFSILFPAYVDAMLYSQVAAIALVFLATMSVLSTTTLKAQEATSQLYVHTIGVSLVRIVLVLALIPSLGVWGAVIALIAHQAAVLISSTVLLYTGSGKTG